MDKKDQKLVLEIRAGDKQAFEQLFRKYYKPLLRFAYKYVYSVPIAKDVVELLQKNGQ